MSDFDDLKVGDKVYYRGFSDANQWGTPINATINCANSNEFLSLIVGMSGVVPIVMTGPNTGPLLSPFHSLLKSIQDQIIDFFKNYFNKINSFDINSLNSLNFWLLPRDSFLRKENIVPFNFICLQCNDYYQYSTPNCQNNTLMCYQCRLWYPDKFNQLKL